MKCLRGEKTTRKFTKLITEKSTIDFIHLITVAHLVCLTHHDNRANK